MRIAIVSMDTRGGVQPYVALALGLQRAGHELRALAPSDMAPLFSAAGLSVVPLTGSIDAVLRASNGATGRGAAAAMRLAARELPERIHAWTKETLDACAGVELISGGVGGMVLALSVAEKLGTPFVEAHLQPVGVATDAYPGVLMPWVPRWLGKPVRRLSHQLSEMALWSPFQGAMASARQDLLGLAGRPTAADGQPVLYGFSPRVVPVPTQGKPPRHVTGYWSLSGTASWSAPPALETFLARGGPIVSVGFGDTQSENPTALTELVLRAVREVGARAVLLSGAGGLDSVAADDVYCAQAVPHDWLLPRVSAVVHHGGAGTTGAALRAGVPAVVVPGTFDQPFWASRVAALGVGPKPIARASLTHTRLARALRLALGDASLRARAASLGEQLRSEDGVANAVACFEQVKL